jgi:hypothetical protein
MKMILENFTDVTRRPGPFRDDLPRRRSAHRQTYTPQW